MAPREVRAEGCAGARRRGGRLRPRRGLRGSAERGDASEKRRRPRRVLWRARVRDARRAPRQTRRSRRFPGEPETPRPGASADPAREPKPAVRRRRGRGRRRGDRRFPRRESRGVPGGDVRRHARPNGQPRVRAERGHHAAPAPARWLGVDAPARAPGERDVRGAGSAVARSAVRARRDARRSARGGGGKIKRTPRRGRRRGGKRKRNDKETSSPSVLGGRRERHPVLGRAAEVRGRAGRLAVRRARPGQDGHRARARAGAAGRARRAPPRVQGQAVRGDRRVVLRGRAAAGGRGARRRRGLESRGGRARIGGDADSRGRTSRLRRRSERVRAAE